VIHSCLRAIVLAACSLLCAEAAAAQVFSQGIAERYAVIPNVTYMTSGSWEGKLDVYRRLATAGPQPTLVWIHGGSRMNGTKDNMFPSLLRYMELGWNVVNVEHRLAGVTLAPAALQNTLCAVRWVIRHAAEYGFDPGRLVISGSSSGGWFAVAAGLGVRPANWEDACPGTEEPAVAAVVNWYGIWELADVLQGPNAKPYAPGWIQGASDPLEVARSLSPLPLRADVPPVISIHGDADAVSPYTQSVRLHEALKTAGVPQVLVTIQGGRHGQFSRAEHQQAYAAIEEFLARHVLQRK